MKTGKKLSLGLLSCNKAWLLAATLSLISATAYAAAGDGAKLVQERHCYGCHHINNALLGPSYTAIAARHRARKDIMVEALAYKIIHGGAGSWGVVPMVPNEQVSEAEAKTIARWILELGG
jgi:cytochrome c